MSTQPIALLADDDDEHREQLALSLEALGFSTIGFASGKLALDWIAKGGRPELITLDVTMPEIDGLETLRRYRAGGGRAPVIMCSGIDETDTVLKAMRAGATDYITKPITLEELKDTIARNVQNHPGAAISKIPETRGTQLGMSPAMRAVDVLVDRIADVDVPVLITGESGVGKDVVAREIHARSSRSKKVFIKINCAALPKELLESELFGHERGSFTGADKTKPGQFELADGGTLFLDEIGEMPISLQAKLLQVLQDGEFYRVGGQRKIKVDARVVVATNVDLAKAIANGDFREDLFYRLNVVQIAIPPLRERREEIPKLVSIFVEKYGKRYSRDMSEVPPEVMERFSQYSFPGNIRELENLVRRLIVLRDSQYILSELKESMAATGDNVARSPEPLSANLHTPSATPTAPTTPQQPMQGGHPPAAPAHHGFAAGVHHSAGNAAMSSPFNSPSPLPPAIIPPPPMSTDQIAMQAGGAVAQQTMVDDYRIDLKELGRKAAHAAEREAIIIMLGYTGGDKKEAAERLGISYKAILYKIREFQVGRVRSRMSFDRPIENGTTTNHYEAKTS